MSDFMDLGPGERIYASGNIREFSWADYKASRNGKKDTIPVPALQAEPAPAPRALRPAGRKKLTVDGIILRDAKAVKRRERLEEDRLIRELEKARKALAKTERRLTQQAEAQAKASRLEEVQRTMNNSNINHSPVMPSPTIKTSYTPAGVPPIPGKIAVRVDTKTVIYVKIGLDIDEAIANYKLKHGLI